MRLLRLLLLQVVSLVVLLSNEVESTSLVGYVREVKQYLMDKAKDGIISRSVMLTSFQDAMKIVQERYNQAKEEGKLDGKDEAEAQVIYYGIVTEEIHNLRKRIESDKSGKLGKEIGQSADIELPAELEKRATTSGADLPDGADPDVLGMDMELEGDDEDEWLLLNEMDHIEQDWLDEAEYGGGLDEHGMAALKLRTAYLMQDLMNNEIRQLATAIVGAYLTGSSAIPVATAIIQSARFKFFEYFINVIMDVLSMSGRKINIIPLEKLGATTPPSVVPDTQ